MPPSEDPDFTIDAELKFQSAELQEFISYWDEKRGARDFPSRKDIVPREIERLLPWLHMFDVTEAPPQEQDSLNDGKDFRVRLMGTAIAEISGQAALPGSTVSEFLHHRFAQRTQLGLLNVLATRKPVRTFAIYSAFPGRDFNSSEEAYAPLSGDGKNIDIIIGVTRLLSSK